MVGPVKRAVKRVTVRLGAGLVKNNDTISTGRSRSNVNSLSTLPNWSITFRLKNKLTRFTCYGKFASNDLADSGLAQPPHTPGRSLESYLSSRLSFFRSYRLGYVTHSEVNQVHRCVYAVTRVNGVISFRSAGLDLAPRLISSPIC